MLGLFPRVDSLHFPRENTFHEDEEVFSDAMAELKLTLLDLRLRSEDSEEYFTLDPEWISVP